MTKRSVTYSLLGKKTYYYENGGFEVQLLHAIRHHSMDQYPEWLGIMLDRGDREVPWIIRSFEAMPARQFAVRVWPGPGHFGQLVSSGRGFVAFDSYHSTMAHLPEGWESDYDGTRWFYRYKTTGLTQYHFPRPGDEFPELVGIGFGPLDLAAGNGVGNEHKGAQKSVPNGTSNVGKTNLADGKDFMGATGYFDPDNFMYFGLNDVSPVGNESNVRTNITIGSASPVAELESAQIRSPVGFVSELASGDTAKCAEELAPIELDATQIVQMPLKSNIHQHNDVAELPTQRSPVEQKAQVQYPTRETMQPVDEYPLVSASFAYPPLKTAAKPITGVKEEPPQVEQKVIASERPPATEVEKNEYETWKPTNRIVNEETKNPNRNSITLSNISVLQSQNTELGPINQKRHSLSGPVESSGETPSHPGILRKPSDPRTSVTTSTSTSGVEASPIPTALQPAGFPTKLSHGSSGPQSIQTNAPSLPGSGARHESISYGSGVSVVGSGPVHIPSVLRPAHDSNGVPENQHPQQTHIDMTRPGTHRVNTLPSQSPSHAPSPPKIGGPGIYVFQEISAATGSMAQQSKPHNPVATMPDPNGQGASLQKPHQHSEHSPPMMNEPLPVVAPLSISKPQKPASPDRTSNTSIQGSIPSSPVLQNKPQKRPSGSQSTKSASIMISSTSIPIRPHPASQQGPPSSIGPTGPNPTSQAQAQAHSPVHQVSPTRPPGQHVQAQNYQKPSVSGSPQHSPQLSQTSSPVHTTLGNTQSQGLAVLNSTYNPQTLVQRPNHGVPATIQNQPSNSSPSPRPQSSQQAPAPHVINQRPDQNTPSGMAIGQHKPHSPSPIAHSVSPLQSQVSSPAPSIASLHRPPSSASSLTYVTTQSTVAQNRPPNPTTHQNSPPAIRPTAAQASQIQVNQQVTQSPNPSVTGGSKPFPMLPGQVKPLPSQVGSPPVLIPNHPAPPTTTQVHYIQGQTAPGQPTQQQPGYQQIVQTAVQRPPQQQFTNGNHVQPTQLTSQQGQPRPSIQSAPGQQQATVQPPANGQNMPTYFQQSAGNVSQIPNGQHGQVITGTVYGASAQLQVSHGIQTPTTQQFVGQPTMQGHQQMTQAPGIYSGLSQISSQNKPFTSAQAAAALSDAGKKMKKWAKKTWQNPALKQSSAAIGGAIIAESLGMNGATGASLGNNIYNNAQGQSQSQVQGQFQAGQQQQQQRPPGLQHAYTAPAQTQAIQSGGIVSQQIQAVSRPQLQQGLQPAGVQTPGRPPMAQNPGVTGAPMNYNAAQPNMANQSAPYQISRPPVGRPQPSQMQQQQQQMQQQMQQPAAFGQSAYQALPNQPVFQGPPGQPLYQARPNPAAYQMPPNQPGYQAPGGVDPYVAIGATIGGALTTLSGNKNDAPAPAAQQHHTQQSEPQHETYSEQQHGGQSEQHHTEQSEQYHGGGGHSEQQYTNQSEQHHESYSGQHQEAHAETHQQAQAEQSYTSHNEQQNAGYSTEDRQTYSEPAPAEPHSNSEAYLAPPPETTIINNTVINNIENTAIAESTQANTNYVDNSNTQIQDTTQMNMNYMDNSQVDSSANANMANVETSACADTTTYADGMANATTEAAAYAEATTYTDYSYADMSTNANTDNMGAFSGATTYVDEMSSYADASYLEASETYIDATAVVDVNVDMSVDMSQTAAYMGEDMSMTMMMEGSMSVDASASYMEASAVDYSGGDWGGGEW
ncbi:hypothetical protein Daesc_004101 [Daldinia eschscholtzii]|uniref:WW domain-containing protein n=1 Tax=Daldinia eschscholtzii TaxID=292717 RepID=A0AAX6MNE3_9PEZI